MGNALFAIGATEWKLLIRNRTVAFSATALPLVMGIFLAYSRPADGGWAMTVALQLLAVLGFTVYFTTSTALTSRREDLYLKRLCSAEPAPVVVLAGMLVPTAVLGVVQSAVVLGLSAAFGAPLGGNPLLLVVAVAGGLAMCLVAGIATSGRTSTAEQAQITTLPFFFAMFGGAIWASVSAGGTWAALLLPGAAVAELVRLSMTPQDWIAQVSAAGPALLALLGWVLLCGVAARSWFRWDPRA
ncbi:ABC transporter permease [Saccharopolyspora erythraea]|uniref:ABC transporter permease n=1 Tax=Saccharopolyspora erythraea TaxID=1836 RepID=UPI001BABE6C4|nr:ABC transporter permease [Saccharopolyspora erythraea]QUH00103.1 ABC transporter permease [Saccharopolyspora erythraea]